MLTSFANEKVSKGSFFTLHEQGLVYFPKAQSHTGFGVCLCAFLQDDPPPVVFALGVLLGRGAVPSAGGRRPQGATRCAGVTAVGTAVPFCSKPQPLCISEAGSGVFPGVAVSMWQQGLPNLPLCVTLEMSFKREKSLFCKTTDKNSTSYSAHPFPVSTQNSCADCNHRNKDLCALGWEGMGWCPTVPSAKPHGAAGGSFSSEPWAAAGSEGWS